MLDPKYRVGALECLMMGWDGMIVAHRMSFVMWVAPHRVPLSEDDLNNPKPEVIKGLLTMYVEVLLNLQSVDHKQVDSPDFADRPP